MIWYNIVLKVGNLRPLFHGKQTSQTTQRFWICRIRLRNPKASDSAHLLQGLWSAELRVRNVEIPKVQISIKRWTCGNFAWKILFQEQRRTGHITLSNYILLIDHDSNWTFDPPHVGPFWLGQKLFHSSSVSQSDSESFSQLVSSLQ